MMNHYHGTPLGGTRDSVARFASASRRFFLVPFGRDEDLPIVSECCAGFILDNGAFSAWKSGKPIEDWTPYYEWVMQWCRHPRFDFAIIPDVIDGDENDNNRLVVEWFRRTQFNDRMGWPMAAPVWHLHESLERLEYLMQHAEVVCLGSSGQWATVGTESWHSRMAEAMGVICDEHGRPKRRIHGLRMLSPEIVVRYPFASCDSTNVAQNSQNLPRFGMYKPPTQAQRREVIAARIEAVVSPAVWQPAEQQQVFELTA